MRPEVICCPVCRGNGKVDAGFYSQTSGTWVSGSIDLERCRSCSGTGVYDSVAANLHAKLGEARGMLYSVLADDWTEDEINGVLDRTADATTEVPSDG